MKSHTQRGRKCGEVGWCLGWVGLFVLAVCIVSPVSGEAAPRKRRSAAQHRQAAQQARQQAMIRAAQAQIAAAKEVLQAAEGKGAQAQARLKSALAQMRQAADDFRDAQSVARHLAKELAEIESDILDEQPADSPFAKAAQRVAALRQKLTQIEEQVLSQEAVARELSTLSGAALAERRLGILKTNPDYVAVKAELMEASQAMDRIRRELFQADPDWRETAKALEEAREEEKASELKTRAAGRGKSEADQTAQDAEEAAAAARVAIAQAEAILRAAKTKPSGKSPSNQKTTNKNKKK